MMLTDHDVDRIASAVVRKLKQAEDRRLDAEFLTMDLEELKRHRHLELMRTRKQKQSR